MNPYLRRESGRLDPWTTCGAQRPRSKVRRRAPRGETGQPQALQGRELEKDGQGPAEKFRVPLLCAGAPAAWSEAVGSGDARIGVMEVGRFLPKGASLPGPPSV